MSPFRFGIEGRTLVVIVLIPDHCLSIFLQFEKELGQIIARTPFVKHSGTFRVECILINDAIFYILRTIIPSDLFVLNTFL